jgi:hypothetical protein
MTRQRQGRWLLKSFTLGFAVTAGLMGADFEWNLPKGYDAGGKTDHPNKSRILRPFPLTGGEKHDLVEFLRSLTDEELLHDPRWSDPWPAMGR